MSEEFAGLEEGVNRYQLLLLVKRTASVLGVAPRAVQLLEYYLAYTRDSDWEEGAYGPVVYQSLARTALDMGVSERQIQKLETRLFQAGLVGYRDSGNHRRYGQRCPTSGRLLYAFGIDLAPLAAMQAELTDKLEEKQLYDEAWLQTKREISAERRAIRGLLAEWAEEGASLEELAPFGDRYDAIAVQIRTHFDLAALRTLLSEHRTLHSDLVQAMGVGNPNEEQAPQRAAMGKIEPISSSRNAQKFVPNKYITHELNDSCSPQDDCFQESVVEPSEPIEPAISAGLHHVTLGMAVSAASQRLALLLPSETNWPDLVEAAYLLRNELGISQTSWGQACEVLGRNGAALCLLVTDRATERNENPVRQPPAYFRAMVNRARAGELRLHSSLFGLLEQETDSREAA